MKWAHVAAIILASVILVQLSIPGYGSGSRSLGAPPMTPPAGEAAPIWAGIGGEEPLITNVIPYGNMETADSADGAPYGWSHSGSAFTSGDRAYTADVFGGSYSGRMTGRSTSAHYSYPRLSPNLMSQPYLSDDVSLDFDWKVVRNTANDTSGIVFVYLSFYNVSHWSYVYYVLSDSPFNNPSNSTIQCYYMLSDDEGVWHDMSRNVTSDFDASPSPYEAEDGWRITDIVLYSYLPTANEEVEVVIDNFWVTDGTPQTFNSNGDFESGTGNGWSTSNTDPSYLSLTQDATEGAWAANMSLPAGRPYVDCYEDFHWDTGYPMGFYATGPGTLTVSFDYKYSDTSNDGGSAAYLEIRSENSTQTYLAFLYLGQSADLNDAENSSYYFYLNATGFGIRDVWHHVELDVFALYSEWGLVNVTLNQLIFRLGRGGYENASVELLIDSFCVQTYPAGDPGFEQDFYSDYWTPLTSWGADAGYASMISYSADVHSGDHSARISPTYGGTAILYRSGFLAIDEGAYTDFWWKLPGPINGTGYALISLYFSPGFYVLYVVGMEGMMFTNSTSNVYYVVENAGTTGAWMNVARNLYDDVFMRFGRTDLILEQIRIEVAAGGASDVEVLFDDMHFIADTTPPEVAVIGADPLSPVYHSGTTVSINAVDNIALSAVTLSYRVGTGACTQVSASETSGHYEAEIPALAYGTEVEYYAQAEDRRGNVGNSSTSSFTVEDDVEPQMEILLPLNNTEQEGIIEIEINALDPGLGSSGLDYFEVFDNGDLLANQSCSDMTVIWNTRLEPNGTHVVTAVVYDVAGNQASGSITVLLNNDFAPPQYSAIQLTPAAPEYDEPVVVAVAITDESEIASAVLHYRFETGSWVNVSMVSSYSLYTAAIPGSSWNTDVYYYISVVDSFGYSASIGTSLDPFTYAVGDTAAPVLSASGPPSNIPLEGVVQIIASAEDEGSGLSHIELLLDGDYLGEATASPGMYVWNTAEVANGVHTITVQAYDIAGNMAVIQFTYTIHNPEGLEPVVRSLTSVLTQYGLVMGVAATAVLIVIGKLLVRRRRS